MTSCLFNKQKLVLNVLYSAGGLGTIIGTATNLVMKGLLVKSFPLVPEYLSFPQFSAFSIPMMICLEATMLLSLCVVFLGWLRPKSTAAKRSYVTPQGQAAAKAVVDASWKELGSITFWEYMVILLFGGSMVLFFCRSPQMFPGWGDILEDIFDRPHKFIKDSALACLVGFLMFVSPSNLSFFKNFTVKYYEQLPKKPVSSVLDWKKMDATLPYSFMFLLGKLAKQIKLNPLWYNLAGGLSASYCFMMPVGTPGNLVVQSAASIATTKMMIAGAGPTVFTIFLTWFFLYFWAPVIWPDLTTMPSWAN
ncbi:Protein I'm not dead yet [Papilio machaon]|uniref:Protein I'm not dead yet n=1 Tax=Papilio machaon TaxID=76193 RepID=A0A194QRQ2_PAPMA|nr:Protein I'm not dead yet [Papilio machaon]